MWLRVEKSRIHRRFYSKFESFIVFDSFLTSDESITTKDRQIRCDSVYMCSLQILLGDFQPPQKIKQQPETGIELMSTAKSNK